MNSEEGGQYVIVTLTIIAVMGSSTANVPMGGRAGEAYCRQREYTAHRKLSVHAPKPATKP